MYLPCAQNFRSIGALSEEIFKKEEDRIHHWQKKHLLQTSLKNDVGDMLLGYDSFATQLWFRENKHFF